jgi:hypothetical protein
MLRRLCKVFKTHAETAGQIKVIKDAEMIIKKYFNPSSVLRSRPAPAEEGKEDVGESDDDKKSDKEFWDKVGSKLNEFL